MNSPLFEILWPAGGCAFLLIAVLCAVGRKWLFSGSVLLISGLLIGSWQYNRTHETITVLNLLLGDNTLVKTNAAHPELSLYHVKVCGLEYGDWEGNLHAKDVDLPRPESVVKVELRKRPFTGTYLKSVANLPLPQFTYTPPPEGREFDRAFGQALPAGVIVEHVFSRSDRRAEMATIVLSFHTDRATFDRIRPRELESVAFDTFGMNRTLADDNFPWWKKPTPATQIWGRNAANYRRYQPKENDHFSYERIVLTWDDDGLVQYFWRGEGLRPGR